MCDRGPSVVSRTDTNATSSAASSCDTLRNAIGAGCHLQSRAERGVHDRSTNELSGEARPLHAQPISRSCHFQPTRCRADMQRLSQIEPSGRVNESVALTLSWSGVSGHTSSALLSAHMPATRRVAMRLHLELPPAAATVEASQLLQRQRIWPSLTPDCLTACSGWRGSDRRGRRWPRTESCCLVIRIAICIRMRGVLLRVAVWLENKPTNNGRVSAQRASTDGPDGGDPRRAAAMRIDCRVPSQSKDGQGMERGNSTLCLP